MKLSRREIAYLNGDRIGQQLVFEQIPEALQSGEVELERQVLRLEIDEGLRRPRDLLSQRHLGTRVESVDVLQPRRLSGETEAKAPRGRRLKRGLAPALSTHGEFAL